MPLPALLPLLGSVGSFLGGTKALGTALGASLASIPASLATTYLSGLINPPPGLVAPPLSSGPGGLLPPPLETRPSFSPRARIVGLPPTAEEVLALSPQMRLAGRLFGQPGFGSPPGLLPFG